MPTYITDILIAFVGVLFGSGVTAYIALKKLKPEVSILDADADRLQAVADETLANAMKTQAEAWKLLAENYGDRLLSLTKRIVDLECQVQMLTTEKTKTDMENDRLKDRVRELEREVERIPMLEAEIENLRQQIIQLGGKPKTGPLGKGKGGAA